MCVCLSSYLELALALSRLPFSVASLCVFFFILDFVFYVLRVFAGFRGRTRGELPGVVGAFTF